jgi:hypothetical protein
MIFKFFEKMKSGRMKRQVILTILISLFMGKDAMAQAPAPMIDLPHVVPPSPNAASLGKFGDIPVGLYTGIPSVGIPLYTVQVGKFSLPVSLNYHYGGMKVEEMASSVGLGWALSAGGAISRSMRGTPDEGFMGYFDLAGLSVDSIAANTTLTNNFTSGIDDGQPDQFTYNFGGQSGKFILDSTSQHNARLIPFANLKISHDAGLDSFQVVDANGIIYIFSTPETTSVEGGRGSATYISSWYLTTIITPAGNINFTYAAENTSQIQGSQLDYLSEVPGDPYLYRPVAQSSASSVVVDARRLVQIQSPFETVIFSSAPGRSDMTSASNITGFDVIGQKGYPIKKFSFRQSYFGTVSVSDPNLCRLKLDGIDEISVSDSTQRKSYNLQYFAPGSVPSVVSKAKDFWGFYNGQDGNNTLLPYIDPTIYGTYVAGQATSYAIRDPDSLSSKVGALTIIQYPTGGTTQFVYEGNDYSGDGTGKIVTKNVTLTAGAGISINASQPIFADTTLFSIDSAQTVKLLAYGSHTTSTERDGYGPSVYLNKIGSDGTRTNISSVLNMGSSNTSYPLLNPGNYELIASIDDDSYSLNAHGLVTYTAVDTSATGHIMLTGGIRIKQIINTDSVGNQNIKSFQYRNPDSLKLSSGTLTEKLQILDEKVSYVSGYAYKVRSSSPSNYLGVTQGSHVGYAVVTETETFGGTTNGKKVSYFSSPWTIFNQTGIQYSITSPGNALVNVDNIHYKTDNDVYRGMLQKELIYNASGVLLRSTVNNYNISYPASNGPSQILPNYYQVPAIVGYKTNLCYRGCLQCAMYPTDNYMCDPYFISNYALVRYQIVCPWIYKKSSINTTYDQNGLNPINDTVYYYYDNPSHGELTRSLQRNSKGDTLKTVNIYASDKSQITGLDPTASAVLDSMVSRNMTAAVIQQEHYNNSKLITRSRTDYAIWNGPRRNISPSIVWSQVSSFPIEDRLHFSAYDGQDNILQVSKVGDMNISYIWDYASEYPVAEVKNADTGSIAYTSFESDGTGHWTVGSTLADSTTGITGTSSYVLNSDISKSGLSSSRTYFVSYWTLNRSSYTIAGTVGGYPIKGKTINGWTLYVHKITGQSTITINGSGHIDELRLYPVEAQMTTYAYKPQVGVTSACDVGNRVTYYEYDGLLRLKRIRDQDHNIIKSIDYQYQGTTGCGNTCFIMTMRTLAGSNTIGFPVGVFNVNRKLLGNAANSSQYVSLWNSDTADNRIGSLSAGGDSLHFNMTLNSGQTLPSGVTGCRYYQVDLAYDTIDAIRNRNAAYVDFGDGIGMMLSPVATVAAPVPANTTANMIYDGEELTVAPYYIHTYPDMSLKTITFYHNDDSLHDHIDNVNNPATSLLKLRNLRGNLSQNTYLFGGSCYQDPSMNTVDSIYNWSSIHSVTTLGFTNGDKMNPFTHMAYAQDFMQYNKGLQVIKSASSYYRTGVRDTTFKLTRLKSDWNTYFTQLQRISINDDHWNREDLSALHQLNTFLLYATTQDHQDDPNSPLIPIPQPVIDSILIQIARGAGQYVTNGGIALWSGGTARSANSDDAVRFLLSRGWVIYVNNAYLTNP